MSIILGLIIHIREIIHDYEPDHHETYEVCAPVYVVNWTPPIALVETIYLVKLSTPEPLLKRFTSPQTLSAQCEYLTRPK